MTFKALTGRSPRYLKKLFSATQSDNYNLKSKQTKLKPSPNLRQIFLKDVSRIGLQNPGTNF